MVEVARVIADGGYKGEGKDEWEFAIEGGGRTVGAGQVTEILERLAEDDGDSGFVFGETMYFE